MGITAVLFCSITPQVTAAGWVTPTGNTDGTGWSGGVLARDGSTATYASHYPALGWGGWETFSLSATIWSDRFRVMADFGYGEVDSVQVDVSPDDVTWITVHAGAVADADWDTKTYTPQNVRYARFRFHRLTTSYIMWLYELQLYEAPPAINLPTITTTAATSVEETSAILHGLLTESGGEPCDIRFQYGLTTDYEFGFTPWVSGFVTGNTSGFMVTGTASGVTYHFRAQARNSQGTVDGLDSTFTCGPAGAGWVSPTGHSDATGRWENNSNIHDDEVGSYARCNHISNDPNGPWGPYIYLLHSSIGVDAIRFIAKDDDNIDRAQVDVTANGATWFNVYDAAFVNQTWTMASFALQYVSQARVRFHVSSNGAGLYWELREVDFQVTEAVGVARTWDGGAGTNNWGDAANWNPDGVPISLDDLTLSGANTIDVNVAGVCNNITLNNASLVLIVKSAHMLTAYGNLTLTSGTLNTEVAFPTVRGAVTISGGTVGYTAASGSQTVAVESYANLVISGGGTKTLAGTVGIAGDLTVSAGTFDLGSFTANRTAAGGTLTVSNGATLAIGGTGTVPSNYSTHSIGATSTINYSGTNQTVVVLNSSQNYGHLTISGSGTKTLASNITVNGTLTLTSGTITTNASALLISSTGSVSRIGGHVVGNLGKYIATGATAKTFEIGDAANYTPINVSFTGVGTGGNLTATTTAGDHPDIGASPVCPSKSANRYWTLTNAGIVFSDCSATFNFVPGDVDGGANTSSFVVAKYSGGTWTTPTVGTRTSTSTQVTGLTGLSEFQIGEPIVLSVTVSNPTFAFGVRPGNTWLTPQTSVITNDGNVVEDLVAQISQFTDGSNLWGISSTANGPDTIRAQWSNASDAGPWTDISAYNTDFTLATDIAVGGTATMWLRIETPTSTTSFGQFSSTLMVTARRH
ncbi:MAG: hypothetical protein V1694_13330 [Candidatus Eisenbacteria bacterium]